MIILTLRINITYTTKVTAFTQQHEDKKKKYAIAFRYPTRSANWNDKKIKKGTNSRK